jgi:UDP-N-acetylmuramoyl-tripeptide--D-alanyl-D-alanine ligase
LYTHVRAKKGKLFVNADDAVLTDSLSDYTHCITYGQEKGDLKGKIEASAPHITIRWSSNGGTTYTVKTQLFGSYNLTNVLAALCIGSYFDVEPAHMNQALAAYVPANNRSQVVHTKLNTVILDAYNANPSSMKLALESFATMEGAKVAILGDMLELGAESQAEHQQIADLANELAIDQVLLVGKEFAKTSKHSRQLHFENQEALSSWLKEQSLAEKQILIKGSRGIALEKALPAIP